MTTLPVLLMACLVTDKIEFEVGPPNVEPTRPTISDLVADCETEGGADGWRLEVRISDPLGFDTPLQALIQINRDERGGEPEETIPAPVAPIEVEAGSPWRPWQFCVPLEQLNDTGCNRVELLVSHRFDVFGLPEEPSDLSTANFWVARPSMDLNVDAFDLCLDIVRPPLELDGGV